MPELPLTLTKLSHFGIGVGLCLLAGFCGCMGLVFVIAEAFALDGRGGGSLLDGGFIFIYVIFGALILGCLYAAFLSFRRMLRIARDELPSRTKPALAQAPSGLSSGTPDERLAHLLKKPNDSNLH